MNWRLLGALIAISNGRSRVAISSTLVTHESNQTHRSNKMVNESILFLLSTLECVGDVCNNSYNFSNEQRWLELSEALLGKEQSYLFHSICTKNCFVIDLMAFENFGSRMSLQDHRELAVAAMAWIRRQAHHSAGWHPYFFCSNWAVSTIVSKN